LTLRIYMSTVHNRQAFFPPQGDIESVAQMNPKELTSVFEAVSGSEDLRKDYDEAQAAMAAADERAALLSGRRKLLNAEKRQKKEQKTEAEKHQAQLEQLVRLYTYSSEHVMHAVVCRCLATCSCRSTCQYLLSALLTGHWSRAILSHTSCTCQRRSC
jgi:hypothetical protein